MTEITRSKSTLFTNAKMTRVALLAAVSYILMFIQMPLPFAPPFMKVDFADVAALIGGFAMGPVYGVMIEFIKCVLDLSKTTTAGVGQLSNFIVGSLFVAVSAGVYRKNKTLKNAIFAMILGLIAMTVAATLSNAFVIFPLYGKIMHISTDEFVKMAGGVNSAVKDYFTMMIFAVVPFNLVKGTLQLLVTAILYKKISPFLKRA